MQMAPQIFLFIFRREDPISSCVGSSFVPTTTFSSPYTIGECWATIKQGWQRETSLTISTLHISRSLVSRSTLKGVSDKVTNCGFLTMSRKEQVHRVISNWCGEKTEYITIDRNDWQTWRVYWILRAKEGSRRKKRATECVNMYYLRGQPTRIMRENVSWAYWLRISSDESMPDD